jgi:(2S)-methylsuccinyl-CoA dehydrogenase
MIDTLYHASHSCKVLKDLHPILKEALLRKVSNAGKIDPILMEKYQFMSHGFAWIATYIEALNQLLDWAERLNKNQSFQKLEDLILQLSFCEYLNQIFGGISMSQSEIIRLSDFEIEDNVIDNLKNNPSIKILCQTGNRLDIKKQLADLIAETNSFGNLGFEDDTLTMIQEQFRRFSDEQILPKAHEWHLTDSLIPLSIIDLMAEMGVFGLTIPENYGGLGMSKTAMCVVTEELSRAYIGVGSLGTRSEIAAELIRLGGTEEQKTYFLPKIASGEILPTAVFTEPNTGSDLGSLRTRATKDDQNYLITGNKTWITHAARSDLMTILVRTDPSSKDWRGLSMLLAEKPRGTEDNPFPASGMTGGEIEVLGYRGMKEYELAFDNFVVSKANLLGGVEGQGFKHLMETFESARIQTAARAVGVAQNALEVALTYARERHQFDKELYSFPRVFGKIVMMVVEIMIARQLTYFAAREKDRNSRCDIEAGMAKLLAARTAWSCADNALQIHGGNGYALEYPISRILCDSRILNIFEGAGEIQANVIAKGLLMR